MALTTSEKRRGPSVWTPGHCGILELTDIDVDRNSGSFRARLTTGLLGPQQSSPLSMIHPVDEEAQIQLWSLYVEKLIDRLKIKGEVPSDYRGFTLKADYDWSGDPVVIVKVLFEAVEEVSATKMRDWLEFASLIQDDLIQFFNETTPHSSQFRFPFVSVGEAAKEEYATSQ